MNNDMNFNNQQNNPQYQNANNMNANNMNMNANMNSNQPNYSSYQSYNNQNLQQQPSTKKNNNIVKIILIILGIIVGIFIIVKIFGGSSSGGGDVGTGKEVTIKNKAYNMTISVGDVQRGVVYTNNGSLLSTFDLDGTYTKVKVTIKNNDSKETQINSYVVPINLMDSSKNKITYCTYGTALQDKNLANEKLQDTIPANSTISGYVYCKTDSNSGTILNINVPSSATTNDTGGYTLNLDEYYFNLN